MEIMLFIKNILVKRKTKERKNKKRTKEGRLKMLKTNLKQIKGITLIALVITIVLNCYRSGRKLEYAM